jgi:ABC-type branched-subunit amino acid transport system ATPase component
MWSSGASGRDQAVADEILAGQPVIGPATAPDDVLRVEHIAKSFGPITAVRDVNLHLRKGEVLGLLGDNGAGKSTLIKIICGFHKQDSGTMWLKGEPYAPKSVDDARAHGIDTVYQDLALVDQLSVYHNLFLRRERVFKPIPFLNNVLMRRQARRASMFRSRAFRGASVRQSPSPAPSPATPTSCCSTSRWRRWAPRRGH